MFLVCLFGWLVVSYKKKREQGINSDHDRGGLGGQAEAQEELWRGGAVRAP